MEDNVYNLGAMASFTKGEDASMPAIVSIDLQRLGETYDIEAGFPCGTIFPELNKPFLAGGMSR